MGVAFEHNAIVAAIGLSKHWAPPATHEIISFVAPIDRPAGERDFSMRPCRDFGKSRPLRDQTPS
jgi:hypothetical protein